MEHVWSEYKGPTLFPILDDAQVIVTPDLMPSLASTAPPRTTEQPCPSGSWDVHHHIFDLDGRFPLSPTRHFTPSPATLAQFEAFQHGLGIEHACIAHGLSFGTDPSSLLFYLDHFQGTARAFACVDITSVTDEEITELRGKVGGTVHKPSSRR